MEIRVKSETKQPWFHNFLKNPMRVIVSSFALVIAVGTVLLMLPISARNGIGTNFVDALFTATSATCVTGLVVADTYLHFSAFGHVVILLLIQLGGLGLVTITTFFNIALRRKLGLRSVHLLQESVNSEDRQDVYRLLRMIMGLTFGFELAGALCLATVFIPRFGAEGIFISIFLAISAYCNAGFDLFGRLGEYSSLTPFYDNPVVLVTVLLLIVFGGLGFVVWMDLFSFRKTKRLLLHSKIVLLATGFLIVFGTTVIALIEWNNKATIGQMNVFEKILNSLFLSVSNRTAGFNTFDLTQMHDSTKLFSAGMMFIGAAPGSTGGGIKLTTFVVLAMTVICVLRGKPDTVIMQKRVDKQVVYKSMAITVGGLLAVLSCSVIVSLTAMSQAISISHVDAIYESVSAFGTVGLSVGITEVSSVTARIALAATMFLGRVGPVSLALSLASQQARDKHQVMPEGRIMVG